MTLSSVQCTNGKRKDRLRIRKYHTNFFLMNAMEYDNFDVLYSQHDAVKYEARVCKRLPDAK